MTITSDPLRLMRCVQQGDHDAFAALYDVLAPLVFGVVKRAVRDPAMSEEVTQEVFVEIWQSAAKFDPERSSVSTWAVTMARRRAIDRVRKEQSQRNRIESLSHQPQQPPDPPDEWVLASIEVGRVTRALGQLPGDQQQVMRLAFIDGHAHGTIAEMLGLPLGTVKGRVRGGLKRLRTLIGDAR